MAHPPQTPHFIDNNFNLIRYLGGGEYGHTWQARANAAGSADDIDSDENIDIDDVRDRGEDLVVKMSKPGFANMLRDEHTVMRLPAIDQCDNVVSSLGFKSYPQEDKAYLIMEYGGPTLFTKLQEHREAFIAQGLDPLTYTGLPREEVREISSQLVNAHTALHSLGVIYRDHKLDNVVVGDGLVVRLIDLGCYKAVEFDGWAPSDLNACSE
ncbi:unnamed protein product [Vitrella brassicaformis CCMP3155]|uniref:Protein kinase domain-containing protein n=1 Tax=Vitrella brassicaformis (strain CCMP3155) TaxID=1169540 RepID=A0A0G4G559_VITBC|nr:unnamed protein product [Vitrella brassicaformis CCMP3155]|eukprot:CEM23347.1 unnamed protein product [Vitrella brassicaformis CCMP3155]